MRYAVTGASGFIGSEICKQLLNKNHEVIALTRSPDRVRFASEIQSWSFENPELTCKNVHAVIHSAAYLPPRYDDEGEALKCFNDNAFVTLKLIRSCLNLGIKSFVYLSSAGIYQINEELATEDSKTFPSFRAPFYLTSKLIGDIFADYYRSNSNIKIATIRPSSVYGTGMVFRGFIAKLITKLKSKEKLTSYDVGNYNIDLVNVKDVAWISVQAAITGAHDIFNAGGGNVISTIELAKMLAEILNAKNCLPDVFLQKQKGHVGLDITKAVDAFNYKPCDLNEELKTYIGSL